MFDQNIKPNVRLMTEDTSFIIAASIRVSARLSNLATDPNNRAAINRTNKATRTGATSHQKLSMQHSFNMGSFSATHYNQSDVDSTQIDVFLALRRDIISLQKHTMPSENETGMRQSVSRQLFSELQFDNLFQGHSRRLNDTGLHIPLKQVAELYHIAHIKQRIIAGRTWQH